MCRKAATTKLRALIPLRLQDDRCYNTSSFLFASRSCMWRLTSLCWSHPSEPMKVLNMSISTTRQDSSRGILQFPWKRKKLLEDKAKVLQSGSERNPLGGTITHGWEGCYLPFTAIPQQLTCRKVMILKFSSYWKEILFFMWYRYHHVLGAFLEFLWSDHCCGKRLLDDKQEIWVFSKACDLGQILILRGDSFLPSP